ncbi:M16 family metallopeptidase [Mucilaginibacter psychrotolerans]|uniref:Insulinase family protein n=1 Tax=Mucilaginibacter psychrotolerans TaxID=1524096 RepID=A0A4Y8SH81_9SPHI|nr:insulinase family protein [Mucilaginibacter psychrotolerans]TFF37766.1 insulinase family protein [Mucilaginibacter psychrotolerans]
MKKKYFCNLPVLLFCFLFTIALSGLAQTVQRSHHLRETPLPLDREVHIGKLPNGFTYYIRHNEEPKNRVTLYLASKAGSILESDDQQGLAHFLEHMSFNGTAHYPKNELINYLQKAGVRFGADINAYTSYDETVYQLPLPADVPEIVENGLQIMRDWTNGATLETIEIDKERGVILEEKRLKKGAQERMQEHYWPLLLNKSRYAFRSPIGTDRVLNTFKPEAIKRFYADWYRPDMQALIIVGDIDVKKMEKRIIDLFSTLKNPSPSKPRPVYHIPLTGKQQFITVTDPEMTSTVAQIIIKQKDRQLITESDYRNGIIRQLYNYMLAQRFAELSRQNTPKFIQGNTSLGEFIGDLSSLTTTVVVKPGELECGVKAVWGEIQKVNRYGFSHSELERAKMDYLNNMESAFNEKDKTGSDSYVNEYLQHFLKRTAAPGINVEFTMVKSLLPGIALADLDLISKTYITAVNRDILILAPETEKTGLPTEKIFSKWLSDSENQDLHAYQDSTSKIPLLGNIPPAGKVISKMENPEPKTITYMLSNGVKVLLKPTDFRNNEIIFSAFGPGGTSVYADRDYQSALYSAGIISSAGAGNYNVNELTKFLSGKQVRVQPYITERTQGIAGATVDKDLETALQLVYAQFTQPRLDTGLFKSFIDRGKATLKNRGSNPNSVFQDSVSAVLGNYNIRRTGPAVAKLDQIDPQRTYKIYKERFADASGFTFIFVGKIDTVTLKPLIEKYIGSLPADHTTRPARDLNINIPAGKIEKVIYKGSEDKATVRLVFSGEFDYTLSNTFYLDALKETLAIRLLERLREDEGGVYSPSVQASAFKLPKGRFTFNISFGCSPANVDKLISSTLDEINKLKTSGPPQLNVDKFIAEERRQQETLAKSNGFWLGYLETQLQNMEPLQDYLKYDQVLESVNPEIIRNAARQYLNGQNYIKFILLPEKSRP